MLDSSGEGFSPYAAYTEEWRPWGGRAALRRALNRCREFVLAEDSGARSFWNYWGERVMTYNSAPMLFGTVEATPGSLKIEALSRACYEALREKVEQVLGERLPPGRVSMPLPNFSDDEAPASEIPNSGELLEEYRRVRERQRELASGVLVLE